MIRNLVLLNPTAVVSLLTKTAFVLMICSIVGQFSKYILGYDWLKGLVPLFDVGNEQNIPTYFSVLLLIFAAQLLAIITNFSWRKKKKSAVKWAILALGFSLMGFDEAFQVHEKLTPIFRAKMGGTTFGLYYYAWVIPGLALVAFVGLFFMQFVLQLPAPTRLKFILAASCYISGAIGMELVGGHYAELRGIENWPYSLIVAIEEGLEITGLITFIWGLLEYCASNHVEIKFEAN